MSTILGPQDDDTASPMTRAEKASSLLSSSPAEAPGRKRTRSTLKSLSLRDASPEKKDVEARKPNRKVSRSSSSGSKKGKVSFALGSDCKSVIASDEDKENQMVIDT